MNQLKNDVRTVLLGILANGPQDNTLGICGNVAKSLDAAEARYTDDGLDDVLDPLFESWPDKSCSTAYPVGSWTLTPNKLFWAHHGDCRSMWDPKTRYGRARLDLLAHMIKELEPC